MKRFMLFLVPVVFLLTSCLKEKSLEHGTGGSGGSGGGGGGNTNYHLECKIAGAAKTFNVGIIATKQDAGGGITVYSIAGKANSSTTDQEAMLISLFSSSPLTVGTTYKVSDASGSYQMLALQTTNDPNIAYGTGTGDTGPTPFEVTITAISSTEIEGTFKGTFFEDDASNPTPPSNPPTKAITEGSFKARFR